MLRSRKGTRLLKLVVGSQTMDMTEERDCSINEISLLFKTQSIKVKFQEIPGPSLSPSRNACMADNFLEAALATGLDLARLY